MRHAAAFVLGLVAVALAPLAGAEAPAGPRLTGPAETVFAWARDACARWDIPDTPARAWRDADGTVRLVAGSEQSRASEGPSLDTQARDCDILHEGAQSEDPAAFDDRSWIHAIHADATGRVEALAHVEYHGHLRPDRCTGDYAACWGNAIVALEADPDGSFRRADPALVATLPYPYDGDHGKRHGYFNPSNIFRRGDALYVFLFAERYRDQRRGVCLLRRPPDGTAADWRAWDGQGFTRAFVDPYAAPVADPARHVCEPLPGLRSTLTSVVRHSRTGLYLAVTPTTMPDAQGISGIYWTVSADLLHWSPPRLLLAVPLLWRRDCAAAAAFAYPSLLDPDSPSPSFASVDDAFWLYLTEMPLRPGCKVGPERNLIRYPVSWPPA